MDKIQTVAQHISRDRDLDGIEPGQVSDNPPLLRNDGSTVEGRTSPDYEYRRTEEEIEDPIVYDPIDLTENEVPTDDAIDVTTADVNEQMDRKNPLYGPEPVMEQRTNMYYLANADQDVDDGQIEGSIANGDERWLQERMVMAERHEVRNAAIERLTGFFQEPSSLDESSMEGAMATAEAFRVSMHPDFAMKLGQERDGYPSILRPDTVAYQRVFDNIQDAMEAGLAQGEVFTSFNPDPIMDPIAYGIADAAAHNNMLRGVAAEYLNNKMLQFDERSWAGAFKDWLLDAVPGYAAAQRGTYEPGILTGLWRGTDAVMRDFVEEYMAQKSAEDARKMLDRFFADRALPDEDYVAMLQHIMGRTSGLIYENYFINVTDALTVPGPLASMARMTYAASTRKALATKMQASRVVTENVTIDDVGTAIKDNHLEAAVARKNEDKRAVKESQQEATEDATQPNPEAPEEAGRLGGTIASAAQAGSSAKGIAALAGRQATKPRVQVVGTGKDGKPKVRIVQSHKDKQRVRRQTQPEQASDVVDEVVSVGVPGHATPASPSPPRLKHSIMQGTLRKIEEMTRADALTDVARRILNLENVQRLPEEVLRVARTQTLRGFMREFQLPSDRVANVYNVTADGWQQHQSLSIQIGKSKAHGGKYREVQGEFSPDEIYAREQLESVAGRRDGGSFANVEEAEATAELMELRAWDTVPAEDGGVWLRTKIDVKTRDKHVLDNLRDHLKAVEDNVGRWQSGVAKAFSYAASKRAITNEGLSAQRAIAVGTEDMISQIIGDELKKKFGNFSKKESERLTQAANFWQQQNRKFDFRNADEGKVRDLFDKAGMADATTKEIDAFMEMLRWNKDMHQLLNGQVRSLYVEMGVEDFMFSDGVFVRGRAVDDFPDTNEFYTVGIMDEKNFRHLDDHLGTGKKITPRSKNFREQVQKYKDDGYRIVHLYDDGDHVLKQMDINDPDRAKTVEQMLQTRMKFMLVRDTKRTPLPQGIVPYNEGGRHIYEGGYYLTTPEFKGKHQVGGKDRWYQHEARRILHFKDKKQAFAWQERFNKLNNDRNAILRMADGDAKDAKIAEWNEQALRLLPEGGEKPIQFDTWKRTFGDTDELDDVFQVLENGQDFTDGQIENMFRNWKQKPDIITESRSDLNYLNSNRDLRFAMKRDRRLKTVVDDNMTGTEVNPVLGKGRFQEAEIMNPLSATVSSMEMLGKNRNLSALLDRTALEFVEQFGHFYTETSGRLITRDMLRQDPKHYMENFTYYVNEKRIPELAGKGSEDTMRAEYGRALRNYRAYETLMSSRTSVDRSLTRAQNAMKRMLGFGEDAMVDPMTGRRIKDGKHVMTGTALARRATFLSTFAANLGQLPLQMFQAVTMLGALGPSGARSALGFMLTSAVGGRDIARNLKAIHGLSPRQFDELADILDSSGFYNIQGTNAQADYRGIGMDEALEFSSAFDTKKRWQQVERGLLSPFIMGEKAARYAALAGAYKINRKKFGLVDGQAMTQQQRAETLNLAGILAGNMQKDAAADIQRGLSGIATQFGAFSLRYAEIMLGGTRGLTSSQVRGLWAWNSLIYGLPVTAGASLMGLPGMAWGMIGGANQNPLDGVINLIMEKDYNTLFDPDIEGKRGAELVRHGLNRGAVESLFYLWTGIGADLERLGPGILSPMEMMIENMTGADDGDFSMLEFVMGPTTRLMDTRFLLVDPVLGLMNIFSKGELPDTIDIAAWANRTGTSLSTGYSAAQRAYMLYHYKQHYNRQGSLKSNSYRAGDELLQLFGFSRTEDASIRNLRRIQRIGRSVEKEFINTIRRSFNHWRDTTDKSMTNTEIEMQLLDDLDLSARLHGIPRERAARLIMNEMKKFPGAKGYNERFMDKLRRGGSDAILHMLTEKDRRRKERIE